MTTVILLFIKENWRKILIGLGITILLLGIFFIYQSFKPQPKIDIETVNTINNANETKRIEELTKKVNDNAEIIKSNDNRTALTDLNIEERDKQIEEKVKEINLKIQEVKQQGRDVTQTELECLLIPESCI